MTIRCGILALFALLALNSPAQAQTITSYTLKVWAVSTPPPTLPISTTPIPAANFVCNQTAPTVPATVANPTHVFFDDTVNIGKVCIYTDTGTGPLLALPFTTQPMNATIAATNGTGTSADSVASNSFTRPGVAPPALTGVRVTP
jgi:hypothetical protein